MVSCLVGSPFFSNYYSVGVSPSAQAKRKFSDNPVKIDELVLRFMKHLCGASAVTVVRSLPT